MAEIKPDGATATDNGVDYIKVDGLWQVQRSKGQSVAAGIGSAAADNILLTRVPLQLLGGIAEGLGSEKIAQGLSEASTGILDARRRIETDFFRESQAQNPWSFLGGNVIGGVTPGNLPVQAAIGGLIGGGASDDPLEQLVGGAIGTGTAIAGDLLGVLGVRRAGRAKARAASDADASRVEAQEFLEARAFPLSEADQALEGATGAGTRDKLRQLINPGASVRDKRRAMNELVTETILPGTGTNSVGAKWRTKLDKAVTAGFDAVRSRLPARAARNDLSDDTAIELLSLVDDISPSRREDVAFYANRVVQAYEAGQLSPQMWSAMRSNIASAARNSQDGVSAKSLYQVRQLLDDIVMGTDDTTRGMLSEANQLWQYREVLNSPSVISRRHEINPNSFIRNLEGMFPQLYNLDTPNPQVAQELYGIADAVSQFPEFKTSGTGEMITASSVAKQLGVRAQLARGSVAQSIGASIGKTVRSAIEEPIRAISTTIDATLKGIGLGKIEELDEEAAANP